MEAIVDHSAFVHLDPYDLRTLFPYTTLLLQLEPISASSCQSPLYAQPFSLHQCSFLHSHFVSHAGQGGTAFTPQLLLAAALHFLLLCHFHLPAEAPHLFSLSVKSPSPDAQRTGLKARDNSLLPIPST